VCGNFTAFGNESPHITNIEFNVPVENTVQETEPRCDRVWVRKGTAYLMCPVSGVGLKTLDQQSANRPPARSCVADGYHMASWSLFQEFGGSNTTQKRDVFCAGRRSGPKASGACRSPQVVSWFSLRQDASETLLKKWGHQSIFLKKMVRKSLKNTHALMVERNYGSNYKGFFFFDVGRINSSSS